MAGGYNMFEESGRKRESVNQINCEKCGKPFFPKEARHKTCYQCFLASKQSVPSSSQRAYSISLPQGYLINGYFESGNLREEYVTTWAEDIAKKLGQGKMKKHQLRRFYNHVKLMERKLELTNDYRFINSDLKALISHAVKASCRESDKVPKLFEEFIRKNLEKINNKESFYGFLSHFQAIVAFCECYLRE